MRSRLRLAIVSIVHFMLAPGVFAGLVPWLLTRWETREPFLGWRGTRVLGGVLLTVGALFLLDCFVRFVREGQGTPAPVVPCKRLVVTGLYNYVRNPMYLSVMGIVVGQALVLAQLSLIAYSAALAGGFYLFVLGYEEPALRRSFGVDYDTYCRNVRRFWPRLTPWNLGGGLEKRD